MRTEGYVIARNRKVDKFFTSSSAYDRPSWIPISEATVYLTPELAQKAAIKLAKAGAYECRVVPVKEAMSFELPADPKRPISQSAGEMEVDIQPDGEGGTEMVAADSDVPCEQCEHCPCTCDEDPEGVDDIVDDELGMTDTDGGDLDSVEGDDLDMDEFGDTSMNPNTDIALDSGGKRLARRLAVGQGGLGESATMPAKPPLDAPSDGNKKTAIDLPAPKEIEFKDPANKANKPDTDLTNSGANKHDDKVKVPANVMADLKAAIAEFNKCAETSSTRDDTKASFCMTVAAAFSELLADLETGTTESIKMAQVHMTSWMNPITANLPASVQKFVYMGGRAPTLKDLFDDKREQRKLMEKQ